MMFTGAAARRTRFWAGRSLGTCVRPILSATPRRLHALRMSDDYDDDELGWWDNLVREDVYDGNLSSSERWVNYSMPAGFLLATILVTTLRDSLGLFPNTPISWLLFFALLLIVDRLLFSDRQEPWVWPWEDLEE